MTLKVQRVPRGLSDLLTIFGGEHPSGLVPELRGVIDVIQFYGLNNLTTLATSNAALAEGGNVQLTVPDRQFWLLYALHATIVKTATMTALRADLQIGQGSNFGVYAAEELGPFGATETGDVRFSYVPATPRVLLPQMALRASLEILGTDATANVSVVAHVGILG